MFSESLGANSKKFYRLQLLEAAGAFVVATNWRFLPTPFYVFRLRMERRPRVIWFRPGLPPPPCARAAQASDRGGGSGAAARARASEHTSPMHVATIALVGSYDETLSTSRIGS